MKILIRVLACTLVIAASATGGSMNRTAYTSIQIAGVPGGGPIPMCNPFVQNCPPVR